MKLNTVNQANIYPQKNVKFSGKLITTKELSRIKNSNIYEWEMFEKSDFMKLLESKSCSGTYFIKDVDSSFSPGYTPTTIYRFGIFKDQKECPGARGMIAYRNGDKRYDIKGFIDTFKNAIVKDVLDTQNIK
jgi:hypothetical protein